MVRSSELSFNQMFCVHGVKKVQGKSNRLTIMEIGDHRFDMANNFSQPSFALRFQNIKIPSLLGRSVGNKFGMRDDTRRGE